MIIVVIIEYPLLFCMYMCVQVLSDSEKTELCGRFFSQQEALQFFTNPDI